MWLPTYVASFAFTTRVPAACSVIRRSCETVFVVLCWLSPTSGVEKGRFLSVWYCLFLAPLWIFNKHAHQQQKPCLGMLRSSLCFICFSPASFICCTHWWAVGAMAWVSGSRQNQSLREKITWCDAVMPGLLETRTHQIWGRSVSSSCFASYEGGKDTSLW